VVKSGWKWSNFVVYLRCKREECKNLFLGEYRHNVDAKNRLRLPPKFKKEFLDGMVLTKGNGNCLFVMPKEQFSSVVAKLSEMPMFDSAIQKPIRMLFSSAVELEEDNQGRFLLPQHLKTYAKIDKNIVFVGVGTRVEIWAEDEWQKYNSDANMNIEQVFSVLGEHGI